MQIKIFSIPLTGGERENEELNLFLRSRKILQVEKHLTGTGQYLFWSFCIQYLDNVTNDRDKEKTDYRHILDPPAFLRFSAFRQIRKQLAQENSVPAYAVFTNEELAELAKPEVLTLSNIKGVKGVGVKKVEKYGQFFVKTATDEKSGQLV